MIEVALMIFIMTACFWAGMITGRDIGQMDERARHIKTEEWIGEPPPWMLHK